MPPKHNRIIEIVALAACTLLLASCGPQDFEGDWFKNKRKWAASGVTSYQLEMQRGCFCAEEITRPMRLVAENGKATLTYTDDGTKVTDYARDGLFVGTVGKMFDGIIYIISENPERLTVEYNEELGYPEKVFVDFRVNTVDDELSFRVTNFEILSD